MRIRLVGSFVTCMAVAFFAGTSFGASQAKSKVTNLLQKPLSEEFAPGREILVDLVEIPPNASLDRHWHPGEEFHYYLDGSPEVHIDGVGTTRPALGTVGHVPFKARHRAGAGDTGAKILVFRVHTTGQPWRYLDDESHEGRDAHRQ
ncbi:MAG TPA: cupin domain-containing protein [Lysobacter sp.]|nr:cupin domain-containing protein [Lysobacter sp.]